MCEPKPGPRCATDTRDAARTTASVYQVAFPAGPDVDPVTSARLAPERVCAGLTDAMHAAQTATDGRTLYPSTAPATLWQGWSAIAHGTRPSAGLDVLERSGWVQNFPELADLRSVAQDPAWHPEGDAFVHSALAADHAAELADAAGLVGDDRTVVVLAAMLHDVGKATHTQHEASDDGTVRITSHGHDAAGVPLAAAFLERVGAPAEVTARILPLVREHMRSANPNPTRAGVGRLQRRLAPATLAEWALVTAADKGGRGTGSTGPGTEQWLALARPVTSAAGASLLRGEHLIRAGLKPGPVFSDVLAAARAAQRADVFTDEAGAVDWLRTHLAN